MVLVRGIPPVGQLAGLFLELEPRVDLRLEETGARVFKVSDFVDLDDLVSLPYGLLEFRCVPRAGQSALRVRVLAGRRIFQQGTIKVVLHASPTHGDCMAGRDSTEHRVETRCIWLARSIAGGQ